MESIVDPRAAAMNASRILGWQATFREQVPDLACPHHGIAQAISGNGNHGQHLNSDDWNREGPDPREDRSRTPDRHLSLGIVSPGSEAWLQVHERERRLPQEELSPIGFCKNGNLNFRQRDTSHLLSKRGLAR